MTDKQIIDLTEIDKKYKDKCSLIKAGKCKNVNIFIEQSRKLKAKEQECESLRNLLVEQNDVMRTNELMIKEFGIEILKDITTDNITVRSIKLIELQQECERLKEAIKTKTGKDYINEIQDITMKYECHQKSMGVCWWGKYGKETKCIGIRECHKRELEVIQKLETELDQLKGENEELKKWLPIVVRLEEQFGSQEKAKGIDYKTYAEQIFAELDKLKAENLLFRESNVTLAKENEILEKVNKNNQEKIKKLNEQLHEEFIAKQYGDEALFFTLIDVKQLAKQYTEVGASGQSMTEQYKLKGKEELAKQILQICEVIDV